MFFRFNFIYLLEIILCRINYWKWIHKVHSGTLRASDDFPSDRYLVELWSPNSTAAPEPSNIHPDGEERKNVGIYYEDITFRDILFDSSYRWGGMFIIDSARTRVHNCFFIHFATEGILVQKGHETFISSCFLGQHVTIGGDPIEKKTTPELPLILQVMIMQSQMLSFSQLLSECYWEARLTFLPGYTVTIKQLGSVV